MSSRSSRSRCRRRHRPASTTVGSTRVLVASRLPSGQLVSASTSAKRSASRQIQKLSIGVFGVAVLDYSARNPVAGFQLPDVEILRAIGAGRQLGADQRGHVREPGHRRGRVRRAHLHHDRDLRHVGGAGVVAEKTSRVMELLISAASARQLVVGQGAGDRPGRGDPDVIVLVPALAIAAPRGPARRRHPGRRSRHRPCRSRRCRRVCSCRLRRLYVLGFTLYALDLRGRRLARQPAGGPPDHRPAAQPDRDRRLPPGPSWR